MDIRAYRRQAGLSQAEFARILGVTQGAVYQWERGLTSPMGRMAAAIVRLTGGQVTLEDLYPAPKRRWQGSLRT